MPECDQEGTDYNPPGTQITDCSQKELAERMGITQAALSQIESGNKKLRMPTLQKLAQA
jgi:transcriptional regulator with XRE-family HTH domain